MSKKPRIPYDLRIRVNKRDKKMCQNPLCIFHYVKPTRVDLHHLYDYSSRKRTRDIPSNLITLCSTRHIFGFIKIKGCHQNFHSWNGGTRVECNPNQLWSYFSYSGAKKLVILLISALLLIYLN